MSLLEDIRKDMIDASKIGNSLEVEILKMVIASIKNEEISKGEPLTDEEVVKQIRKETKKIEDSISDFEKMGRVELVEKEKKQLGVLIKYLPALMSTEEIEKVVSAKIEEMGAESMRDMGRVMSAVMEELKGKADGSEVRNIVQQKLS